MPMLSSTLRAPKRALSIAALLASTLGSMAAHAAPVAYDSGLLGATSSTLLASQAGADDTNLSTALTQPDPLRTHSVLSLQGDSAEASGLASQNLLSLQAQALGKTTSAEATASATFLGNFSLQAGQSFSLDLDLDLHAFTQGAGQSTGDLALSLNFDQMGIIDQTFDHSGHYHWAFDATGPLTATLGLTLSGHANSFGLGQALQQGSARFAVNTPAVPEPDSAAMVLAALGVMGMHAQWRKSRASKAQQPA